MEENKIKKASSVSQTNNLNPNIHFGALFC